MMFTTLLLRRMECTLTFIGLSKTTIKNSIGDALHYEEWCSSKRKKVWKIIHKDLLRKDIRIDPLLVENTVFQVQNIDNEKLLVTPLHLVNGNEFLILLSKKYGLTYYVNLWEYRKLVHPEKRLGENNRKESDYFYNAGVHALNNNDVSNALDFFKKAIQFHPVYASSEIFKGWWERFSRDTSEDFNNFKDLFRGITSFKRGFYKESIKYLRSFVENHPDYLADPYLLISFQENQISTEFFERVEERKRLIKDFEKTRETYNIRYEVVKSNSQLLGLLKKFNNTDGSKKDEIGYYIKDHYKFHQVEEVERISNELTELEEHLKNLEGHINIVDKEIPNALKDVWRELKKQENLYIKKALQLDSNYVNKILNQEKIEFSEKYQTKLWPFYDILKGDEFIHIAEVFSRLSTTLKNFEGSLYEIKLDVDKCLKVEYLQEEDLVSLKKFKEKIESFSDMDSITRELVFRDDINRIAQDYFQKGLKHYNESLKLLHIEYVEPFKKWVYILSVFRPHYRKALEIMTSALIPLRNFSPQGTLEILDKSSYNVTAVKIDRNKNLIKIKDHNGNELPLIKFNNLSNIEIAHLEDQASRDWFIQHLSPLGSNTAEQILNTYIPVSPVSQEWNKLLKELQGWFIKIMAYTHSSPVPMLDQMNEKSFDVFEELRAVERTEINFQNIKQEFLDKVDIERKNLLIINV